MADDLTAPDPKDVERFFELFPLLPADAQEFLVYLTEQWLTGAMPTKEVISALKEKMQSPIS